MEIAAFLSEVNGFSALGREELVHVAQQVQEQRFHPADYLIRKGEAGETMYIVYTGRLRVPIVDSSGREKMVVTLGPGDLVGEMALLTGDPRTADVIADSEVTALVIDRDTLQPLLRSHPPLARFLTEILGKRLEEGGGIERVGKYWLLGKIGEGATSKVYQALHPALNRLVAIKMLSHSLVYDVAFRDRFLQEARTIAGLMHPNIVQIFDTEASYGTYFLVMEKVSGTDLSKLLKARKALPPLEAMRYLRQVASALQHAHKAGVVHRDVKPANVAVNGEGRVKLMDFGIARRIQKQNTQERAKLVEGTPRYLAPEAAVGRPVDGRADIYSLGIMAYEMVTGRVPFYSDTIRDLLHMHVRQRPADITRIRPGLPEGLVQFINGALIKRPDERLTDWDQILRLLAPDAGDAPVDLHPTPNETRLLSISFPPDARDSVTGAITTLVNALQGVGAEVSSADLQPITPDTAASAVSTGVAPVASGGLRD